MATTLQPGVAVAPTLPAAPKLDEWWKQPGVPDTPTGLIGQPATWTPTADQTVQGQVKNIIADDSLLMQQAKGNAAQEMNARGLLNTSINTGAAQGAVLKAALPIASQDAQTYARAAEFNAGATNALQGQSNQLRQQAATTNLQIEADQSKQNLDNLFKASMVNADAQTKAYLTQAEGDIKQNLINIEADYKTLIQTSATAGEIYKMAIASIAPIIADTNMTAASKTAAINGLFGRTEAMMNVIGSINGIDMSWVDFGTVA